MAASVVLMLNTCTPLPSVIDQIKILGELRVVTRVSPLSYYRDADGTPTGPEFDLARRFADELGVGLSIVPVHSYAQIYAALESGRAHVAAAALKVPAKSINSVSFGPVYQRVREHLVYRRGSVRPSSLADIGAGDLEIAAGSSHAKALRAARDKLPGLAWVENATTDSQALLQGVADGSFDYTIADSTEFALAHDEFPDLRIAFDFPGSQSLAWAASSRDPDFLSYLTGYFSRLSADGQLAAIVKRYYGRPEDMEFSNAPGFMRHVQYRLPLYKKWFEEAAVESSQDWRLLAAIGYQESKWDPDAASSSGAKGLMQLTTDTASAANVDESRGSAPEHFRRRPLFQNGVLEDSRTRARARPHLVRAGRVQHRLRPRRRRAGADSESRARSGFLAGRARIPAAARAGRVVHAHSQWLRARIGTGALRGQRARISRHAGMGLGQHRRRLA